MRSVGVLEAKTNLSNLLDDVLASGEPILITRHGKPVARLAPEGGRRRLSAAELAARTRAFRDRQAPDPEWSKMSWEELKALARDEDHSR